MALPALKPLLPRHFVGDLALLDPHSIAVTPSDTVTYVANETLISPGMSVALNAGTDMLRISQGTAQNEGGAAYLRLEGQVTGPWVEELRRVCTETLRNNGRSKGHLVIDLADVSFLDAEAIALFRELAAHRVSFTNHSAFIAEQLKGVADGDK